MKKKFLRRDVTRFGKFGNGRGKKAKWRSPKGRDNKMREQKKGYPITVSIGYGSEKSARGKFKGKSLVEIFSVEDLQKVGKDQIGVVMNVGKKRKLEIAGKAKEMKVELKNMNLESYLKKNKKKTKKTEEKKDKHEEKKK